MVLLQMEPAPRPDTIILCRFDAVVDANYDGRAERVLRLLSLLRPEIGRFIAKKYLEAILDNNTDYRVNNIASIYSDLRSPWGLTRSVPLDFLCDIQLGSFKFVEGKIVISNHYLILLCSLLVAVGQYPNIKAGLKEVLTDLSAAKTYISEIMTKTNIHDFEVLGLDEQRKPLDEVYSHLKIAIREDFSISEMLSSLDLPPFE